ncbi:MAG: class I SAM-dependent methyltransferase [Okeania sp. SIO3C4]|nr:class I SAM-dependent methyltransferase [Okeania sp. SIO3B3]NER04920.1 class I SAM-dependent methyltransferase [Okeania sp. SIO3C4]
MVNQYTDITEYYDMWVKSGYYDYQNMAKEVNSVVGNGRQILELGVGTGLMAEKYIELDPTCEFTGIDFTPSMLKIAEKRLGDKVKLIEADAVTMDLNRRFDVAVSNGGVWIVFDCGDLWELGTHIPGIEPNLQSFKNVGRHLQEGELFLLNLQKPHSNFEKKLSEEIVYSQLVNKLEDTKDYYILEKSYFFKKDGEIMAQEKLTLTFFKQNFYQKMFAEAGFDFQGLSNNNGFVIYKKR